ncbi:MAG: imidazoleglycerol-phosphate dehydratase, partial [Candidatus Omnitrophota bacterium]
KPYELDEDKCPYTLEDGRHFLDSFVKSAVLTMHISILSAGSNSHHLLEAIFKAMAKALDEATQIDPRVKGIPSTKGRL